MRTKKVFIAEQFDGEVKPKVKYANKFVRFVDANMPNGMFPQWFYERTTQLFGGFDAMSSKKEFFEATFGEQTLRDEFLRVVRENEPTGEWSDVETLLREYVVSGGEMAPVKGGGKKRSKNESKPDAQETLAGTEPEEVKETEAPAVRPQPKTNIKKGKGKKVAISEPRVDLKEVASSAKREKSEVEVTIERPSKNGVELLKAKALAAGVSQRRIDNIEAKMRETGDPRGFVGRMTGALRSMIQSVGKDGVS